MLNRAKKNEDDLQKALENAAKKKADGMLMDRTNANNGKDFLTDVNASLDKGRIAIQGIKQQQWLAQYGLDATAEIIFMADTGTLVNMNHVVEFTLKVQPARIAAEFETTGITMVPRASIPHVGEHVKVKYNPADPTQFIFL